MVNGETVKQFELKSVLGAEHWLDYLGRTQSVKAEREIAQRARDALLEYTRLLQVADMQFGNAERLSQTRAHRQAKRLQRGKMPKLTADGAETLREGQAFYERALERLSELIAADKKITTYLDRAWDYGEHGSLIDASKERVPRLMVRYRADAEYAGSRDMKIDALKAAIENPQVTHAKNTHSVPRLDELKKLTGLMRH